MFADDVSLFTRGRDINITHEQLVNDLNVISAWAYQWKMKFNPDITKQTIEVILSTKYKKAHHPLLDFNGIPVARKSSTKHLKYDSKLLIENLRIVIISLVFIQLP